MTDALPSSDKELCNAVMDVRETTKEELGNDCAKGHEVNCLDCGKCKKFVPTKQGFTNAAEHWNDV